jgi:NCS1 family nucleobase:cation symporter-1
MIADYYFIRKQQLNTHELYLHRGEYSFNNGINYKAIAALLLGIIPNIPGFLTTIKVIQPDAVPGWVSGLYNYAWFVGFFVSGISYMLMTGRKSVAKKTMKDLKLETTVELK